jgi:hypothetical protein
VDAPAPTIIETSSSKKKLAGEEVTISDVCFKRDGVFAMELGGPEVGRGCGGRGIIHGFELLEKLGFHEWGFDYVLLDFLGDVVCGGFGLPIARDMCQKVIVVGSNDLQSLYVANNVCSAVEYFRKLGGNVGVAGMVINKDDGTGEAAAFAASRRHPGSLGDSGARRHPPQERQLRDRRHPDGTQWGPMFETLATNVGEAPPVRPKPLTQDELLGLFASDVVGAMWCSSRRRRSTWSAARTSRSRRSKSSTTRSERCPQWPLPVVENAAALEGDGSAVTRARSSCRRRRAPPARARRWTSTPRTIPRDRTISRSRCARPSGRCAWACGCVAPRRSSRVGLLRVRPDVHVALLWRAPHRGLCAVQLGDARHGQALRGHPRRRLQDGRSGAVRRDRHHESLRADGERRSAAAAAEGDQRRAHHRH